MGGEHSTQAIQPGPWTKLDAAQKLRLQKAVREFESIFVGYMLKSMRNTVEKADNSTGGFGTEMLEGMFDVELAKHISGSSNLGLAEMLYRTMTGESLPRSPLVTRVDGRGESTKPGGQVEQRRVVPEVESNTAQPQSGSAKTLTERLRSFDAYIREASERFGVKDSLIRAVIAAESSARPDARSAKDAKGLMQLLDATAEALGVKNIWDPRENILGGAKYLKQLLEQFDGDERLALASYNAGPAVVQKHGGIPPYPETREYVARVMKFVEMIEQQEDGDE
ncbi:MAG: murein transglycosylase [Ignavibacteria bacterium]